LVSRDEEVEQALDILANRHANSVLLLGRPGVGKTSVARGLAQRFAADSVDGPGRLLIELPLTELLAGTGARGSLAERAAALRSEVRRGQGRIVLFIDEIHELISGGGGDELVAELKAALSHGELPLIGATTPSSYQRTIESDGVLARRFSIVDVEEPDEADTFLILRTVADGLEGHHGVAYTDPALAVAVSWSIRYLPGRALPDKAVSILDLAGARARRRAAAPTASRPGLQAGGSGGSVDREQIAEVVSELADVPMERLLQTDNERLLQMEKLLAERVVGHPDAMERIAAVLRRNGAGLRGRRPIGTFLLLGPTGVGKTETAKAVAEALFHSPDAMTRLDMSEYAEPHSVARLIGAPPGYVGHEAGGELTEAVRRRPYQVVLLDEIEKAHRDVLEAFLQLFDEGRLTDGRGRCVDYTNTVIVMTSNLGSGELRALQTERRVGFGATQKRSVDVRQGRDVAIRAAKATLPPELYNRIDEVLFYRFLERRDVHAIAERLLDGLAASLGARGVELEVERDVIEALMDAGGFDPEFGARPMRRAIARRIEAPLADLILRGDLERGSVALVSVEDGEILVDAVESIRERSA
jgi:ATP-dependent Clp protease ATP-binding subunit ClpC